VTTRGSPSAHGPGPGDDLLALAWSPGRARLLRLAATGGWTELWRGRVHDAYGSVDSHTLRVWAGKSGAVVSIVTPGGTRAPFLRSCDGGTSFERVVEVPGAGALAPEQCRAHGDGTLTVVEGSPLRLGKGGEEPQRLWALGPASRHWTGTELPEAFRCWDVSVSPDGALWVCGDRATTESTKGPYPDVPTEPAVAVVRQGALEYVGPPSDRGSRRVLARYGHAATYDWIDAGAEPVLSIFTLERIHGGEDAYLLVADGQGHRLLRFKKAGSALAAYRGGPVIRLLLAEDVLCATQDHGRSWTTTALPEELRRHGTDRLGGAVRSGWACAVGHSSVALAMQAGAAERRASAVLVWPDQPASPWLAEPPLGQDEQIVSLAHAAPAR
jgi:hypothetical protein